MSNPPTMAPNAAAAVAAVAARNKLVPAQSAAPLGHTQAQGLKRAFEGMYPIAIQLSLYLFLVDFTLLSRCALSSLYFHNAVNCRHGHVTLHSHHVGIETH